MATTESYQNHPNGLRAAGGEGRSLLEIDDEEKARQQEGLGARRPSLVGRMSSSGRRFIRRRRRSPLLLPLLGGCILVLMVTIAVVAIFFVRPPPPVTAEGQRASLNAKRVKFAKGGGGGGWGSWFRTFAPPPSSSSTASCSSDIILMRHCEKKGPETKDEHGDEHCSAVGFERAEHLPTLFGDAEEVDSTVSTAVAAGAGDAPRWPLPVHLYALSKRRPGVKHSNYREIETLTPLADAAGLKIDARFTQGAERDLAEDVFGRLASGEYCNGVSVISWKHGRIADMAKALGCGPGEGCPAKFSKKDFESMWVIRYEYVATAEGEISSAGEAGGSQGRRRTKKKKRGKKDHAPHWVVSGKVMKQGFAGGAKKASVDKGSQQAPP